MHLNYLYSDKFGRWMLIQKDQTSQNENLFHVTLNRLKQNTHCTSHSCYCNAHPRL